MIGPSFAEVSLQVPAWSAIPFGLLLAAVAVLPLASGQWWHRHGAPSALGEHRNKAIVVALLAAPTALFLLACDGGTAALLGELRAYLSFVVLLAALYAISGGIALRGTLPATTAANLGLLLAGAVLANVVGTTGASLLLVRPLLRANARRVRRAHVPVFFTFVVGNTGGLLTPLGDPPLFLGYLQGVDFFWTLRLWPQWLAVNGAVLAAFAFVDRRLARKERPDALRPEPSAREPLRLDGWRLNGALMAAVVLAVLAQKALPFPAAEAVMAGCIALSLRLTPARVRAANRFAWGPMAEVAVLFLGIFVAMVPALALLSGRGAEFGLDRPDSLFWATGLLSSVLDNAPTYLSLGTAASGGRGLGALMAERPNLLAAVSCGAVFMGANSYVGNGPNFMVKAIAEGAGYRMPSFFGYVLYAAAVLLPVYAVVSVAFFRPA